MKHRRDYVAAAISAEMRALSGHDFPIRLRPRALNVIQYFSPARGALFLHANKTHGQLYHFADSNLFAEKRREEHTKEEETHTHTRARARSEIKRHPRARDRV